jgi:branched-chain amino acid transport system permease protein
LTARAGSHPRALLALRAALALAALAVLALPALIAGGYALGIVNLMLINVIVVLGLNVIWGFAGQIALGQAGFVAVGAYTVAVMSVRLHLSFWVDLACGALLAALAALALGLATLRLRSFYLGLATLSFGEIVEQVLLNWKALSQSANGIVNIPQASLFGSPLEHGWQQYYLLLAFAAAGAWVSERMTRVRFGLECRAVRGNERAARMIGIDAFRVKLFAFVLSAVYGGVAGGLYAQLYQAVSPDVFSFDYMVSALAMLLIGGAGSTGGAVVGAVLVTALPELLRFLGRAYLMVYGFGLVALIIYAPHGIWGAIGRVVRRGAGGRAKPAGPAAGEGIVP